MKDSMLCAIGCRKQGVILAYRGDMPLNPPTYPAYPDCRIGFELDQYSEDLNDHFKDDELPKEPGIYVWEGSVILTNYTDGEGGQDCDVSWEGKFRPAKHSDFSDFNVTAPNVTWDI